MPIEPRTTGLTYADLREFPEDNVRRELIDGELIVSASPSIQHQGVVTEVLVQFYEYCKEHGGMVFPPLTEVYLSDRDLVEPDVLYVGPDNLDRLQDPYVRGAPDIVIEISSPSTRRLELVRKRELYERYGVPEYWYVDLDAERVELYRLSGDRYGQPEFLRAGEAVTSPLVPGLSIAVADLLAG